jgi:uncharacterized protein YjdB
MVLIGALVLLGACENPTGEDTVTVAAVAISPANPSVAKGGTIKLEATVSPADATDKTVTWQSSSATIATVDDTGLVTGKAVGTAKITATSADGPSGTVTVTVKLTTPPTGISLSPDPLNLNKGDSGALTPAFTPADADTGIRWTSSNTAVARVNSSTGAITAAGGGTAEITATSTADSGIQATATVNVTAPLTGISLSPNPLTVGEGSTDRSFIVIYDPPDTTTEKSVVWSSSDSTKATVDSSTGLISAVATGTAEITAVSTADSGIQASATVNVVVPVPIAGLTLSPASLNLNKGDSGSLTPVFAPASTTDTGLSWTSSNTAVARVNSSTGAITAAGGGTATITATSTANRTISAGATVNVTVPLAGISLGPNPLALDGIGATGAFTVIYDPPDTTQTGVTWSSGNSAVATVSDGTVTATGGGTATITAASTADPAKTAGATVSVSIPIAGLSLNTAALNLNKGASGELIPVFAPADATARDIIWLSSNSAVATVANGAVAGVGGGTATITAISSANSNISARATVSVTAALTGISVRPATLRLGTGSTSQLTVTYEPSDTTAERDISWSSGNSAVATVDPSTGEITAVSTGSATITATSKATSSISASATVNVVVPDPITGLTLSQSSLDLARGSYGALTPVFTPASTTDTEIIWSSNNPAVATVSDGRVTAVGKGTATITATSKATSSISATVAVTVNAPLARISLSRSALDLDGISANESLTVYYNPEDTTTTKGVTWSSSDPSVATVDAGKITAVEGGTAIITATSTEDPTKTASATVNVIVRITKLELKETTLPLNKGATGDLTPEFTPPNTTQKDLYWTSSNTAVAVVSGLGRVTAVGGGEATITATSTADPDKTDTAKVTVTVPITGLRLSPATLNLNKGVTGGLTPVFTPSDTTQKSLTWKSSDEKVATVDDSTGKIIITPVAGGTATITATSTESASIEATATVNVINNAVVNIEFEGLEDETITLSKKVNQWDNIVVTAPSGFNRYLWYFDGVDDYWGATATYSRSYTAPGTHSITVIVEKDGKNFSKTLIFTVGY